MFHFYCLGYRLCGGFHQSDTTHAFARVCRDKYAHTLFGKQSNTRKPVTVRPFMIQRRPFDAEQLLT